MQSSSDLTRRRRKPAVHLEYTTSRSANKNSCSSLKHAEKPKLGNLLLFSLLVAIAACVLPAAFWKLSDTTRKPWRQGQDDGFEKQFPSTVSLDNENFTYTSLSLFMATAHFNLPVISEGEKPAPNFGGLKRSNDNKKKGVISDEEVWHIEKEALLAAMDVEMTQNFDKFDERTYPRECVRPAWADLHFCNCNDFHELAMDLPCEQITQRFAIRYLASGHFRDAFSLQDQEAAATDEATSSFVLKQWRLDWYLEFDQDAVDRVRREALLMERMSASPSITNVYGYCAVSAMVETLRDVDFDILPLTEYQERQGHISVQNLTILQEQYGSYSLNNFTAEEKLQMSIDIAESLAEMHGLDLSVVVNNDVLPRQWLMNAENRMVLNDLNYGIFLAWNEDKQEYCKVRRFTGGDLRSPEEFDGRHIDESADVWPMGSVIYCLLTGLFPYYDIPRKYRAKLEQMALDGKRPYIDPRIANGSLIERRLVEIMNRCHVVDPTKRATIFEVLQFLRETKELHQQEQERLSSKEG